MKMPMKTWPIQQGTAMKTMHAGTALKRREHGQVAVEYSILLVCVALVLFVSVDGVSLLSLLLDAIRHLNFSYINGLGVSATPI
jgi:Flp pilus assembly pilin Flp